MEIQELTDILPYKINKTVNDSKQDFYLAIHKNRLDWSVFYGGNDYCLYSVSSEKLKDCLSKMRTYLIKNKLTNTHTT